VRAFFGQSAALLGCGHEPLGARTVHDDHWYLRLLLLGLLSFGLVRTTFLSGLRLARLPTDAAGCYGPCASFPMALDSLPNMVRVRLSDRGAAL